MSREPNSLVDKSAVWDIMAAKNQEIKKLRRALTAIKIASRKGKVNPDLIYEIASTALTEPTP